MACAVAILAGNVPEQFLEIAGPEDVEEVMGSLCVVGQVTLRRYDTRFGMESNGWHGQPFLLSWADWLRYSTQMGIKQI